jgi:long-chain fatty acid transport protein
MHLTWDIGFGLPGLLPQSNDGIAELKGDAWGVGWNVGFLYQFTKSIRIGISYRSTVSYKLKGDAEFSRLTASFQAVPALRNLFKNCNITARLKTPDSLSISLHRGFSPQWVAMGGITWTNWHTFDGLRIRFENPYQPNSVVTTDWKDALHLSLGGTFTRTKTWTFRFGKAYDQAPTPTND